MWVTDLESVSVLAWWFRTTQTRWSICGLLLNTCQDPADFRSPSAPPLDQTHHDTLQRRFRLPVRSSRTGDFITSSWSQRWLLTLNQQLTRLVYCKLVLGYVSLRLVRCIKTQSGIVRKTLIMLWLVRLVFKAMAAFMQLAPERLFPWQQNNTRLWGPGHCQKYSLEIHQYRIIPNVSVSRNNLGTLFYGCKK